MMDPGLTELLGYAAAGLVLAAFSVHSITALRSVAIASNLLFIAYAACAHLLPVLVLHALLLPLNLVRLRQALAGTPGASVRAPGRKPGRRRPGASARRASWRAPAACWRMPAEPVGTPQLPGPLRAAALAAKGKSIRRR